MSEVNVRVPPSNNRHLMLDQLVSRTGQTLVATAYARYTVRDLLGGLSASIGAEGLISSR